jgi:uncharacterized protein
MVLAAIGVAGWVAVGGAVLLAAVVLPPVFLRSELAVRHALGGARGWRDRVLRRYRRSGIHAWMFAWFKTRMDPMFVELPAMVKLEPPPRQVLDVGCGQGCAGCAVLEWVEGARIYGVDPDARRVKAAGVAFGERGQAAVGAAPELALPEALGELDAVLMLDMIHYVSDAGVATTLRRVHERMRVGGRLIMRATVPVEGRKSWKWRLAEWDRRVRGGQVYWRTEAQLGAALTEAGFMRVQTEISGGNAELRWFTAWV